MTDGGDHGDRSDDQSIGSRMRADVDAELDRLRDEFGAFPVREAEVENDPDYFAEGVALARQGWRGDAGAFVIADAGRALFIRHSADPDRWGLPGGGHEPGESHVETAVRETREETGVAVEPVDVFQAIRRTIRHAEDPGRTLTMLTVHVDARPTSGTDVDVGDEEVVEARWFDPVDPPDAVHDQFEARVRRWAES